MKTDKAVTVSSAAAASKRDDFSLVDSIFDGKNETFNRFFKNQDHVLVSSSSSVAAVSKGDDSLVSILLGNDSIFSKTNRCKESGETTDALRRIESKRVEKFARSLPKQGPKGNGKQMQKQIEIIVIDDSDDDEEDDTKEQCVADVPVVEQASLYKGESWEAVAEAGYMNMRSSSGMSAPALSSSFPEQEHDEGVILGSSSTVLASSKFPAKSPAPVSEEMEMLRRSMMNAGSDIIFLLRQIAMHPEANSKGNVIRLYLKELLKIGYQVVEDAAAIDTSRPGLSGTEIELEKEQAKKRSAARYQSFVDMMRNRGS